MKQIKLIFLSFVELFLLINYIQSTTQFIYTPQIDQSKETDQYDYKPGN